MKGIVLLIVSIIFTSKLFAQLKEFEISPLPKPEISLVQANTEFVEDALIIIYSSLTNLNFRSSMGMIDKQSYNPQSNRYEILVRPIKQILLVYSNGFMEGTISTINPNAKDVLYFKVEEKKTVLLNQTVVPGTLTINSTPTGANISLNGIPVATKTPFTGELNPGLTRIQLSKTKYQTFDTVMNVRSSINEMLTIYLKPSFLWLNITSNPTAAKVELDGVFIGTTPLSKELDLTNKSKQGTRSLKLTLSEYVEQSQTIQLFPSKDPLKVSVELKKIEGNYFIESTPSGAEVFIDGVYNGQTPLQGTMPFGKYSVELKLEDYSTSPKKQIIVNEQTTANLKENLILKKQTLENSEGDLEEGELVKNASGNSNRTFEIGDKTMGFKIIEMSRPEGFTVQPNSTFPQDALIIVYSSLDDLSFRSSSGAIDKQYYNMRFNRYEILVRPLKQMIFVIAPDIMEQKLLTINPKHNEEFYIKVEENSELELLKDASGNIYKTVKIGDQVWMAENLKTEKYSNGELIPNVIFYNEWSILETGAWCNYNNSEVEDLIYGKLYNWYTVSDSRNVCPLNWHVPSDEEWSILLNHLGGVLVAGGKMKTRGTLNWESPNKNATNESGFSGLPAGLRLGSSGEFYDIGSNSSWWSSSKDFHKYAWSYSVLNRDSNVLRYDFNKKYGFSIRCIKD